MSTRNICFTQNVYAYHNLFIHRQCDVDRVTSYISTQPFLAKRSELFSISVNLVKRVEFIDKRELSVCMLSPISTESRINFAYHLSIEFRVTRELSAVCQRYNRIKPNRYIFYAYININNIIYNIYIYNIYINCVINNNIISIHDIYAVLTVSRITVISSLLFRVIVWTIIHMLTLSRENNKSKSDTSNALSHRYDRLASTKWKLLSDRICLILSCDKNVPLGFLSFRFPSRSWVRRNWLSDAFDISIS